MTLIPGPSAPVPMSPVGFDASAGLALLLGIVALGGVAVLVSALVERGRRWCEARREERGLPASTPA